MKHEIRDGSGWRRQWEFLLARHFRRHYPDFVMVNMEKQCARIRRASQRRFNVAELFKQTRL